MPKVISIQSYESPIRQKLRELDKKRAEKAIENWKRKLSKNEKGK